MNLLSHDPKVIPEKPAVEARRLGQRSLLNQEQYETKHAKYVHAPCFGHLSLSLSLSLSPSVSPSPSLPLSLSICIAYIYIYIDRVYIYIYVHIYMYSHARVDGV